MEKRNKVVFFDLDGTLTTERSIWQFIHKKLGTTTAAEEHKNLFYQKKISFSEWGILDASLWKKTSIEKMNEIMQLVPFVKEIEKTLLELKNRGFYNIIITSSLSLLYDELSNNITFDRCIANILGCKGSCISGDVKMIVTDENKGDHVEKICRELKINPNFCVAVGDSKYDMEMFKKVGFAIAFNPNDIIVKENADCIVNSESLIDIIPLIDTWLLKNY